MPNYIEYDKITRQIRRVLSADDLPSDAAHLSYVEVPIGTPEMDLSLDIDAVREIIDGHQSRERIGPTGVADVDLFAKPLIEEI